MAIPTFTSVTPSVGYPGGGQVVEIAGTGFRTASVAYNVPQAESLSLVQVTFGGEQAEYVDVVSDVLLRVAVPEAVFDPFIDPAVSDPSVSRVTWPPVNIVITNVDVDGVPIPGETVTAVGAYTYEQPLIRLPEGDPPLLQVLRKFVMLFMRGVVSDVAQATHTDYGEEGEDISVLSEHPSIGLRLRYPRDPEYSYFDNEKQVVPDGAKFTEFDMQRTVMMLVDLTLSSRSETELQHMMARTIDLQLATPWLKVPRDPDWPEAGPPNKYPLEWVADFEQVAGISRTNVQAYTAQMRVRGIPVVRGDASRKNIGKISTILLTTTNMQGDSPQTTTV